MAGSVISANERPTWHAAYSERSLARFGPLRPLRCSRTLSARSRPTGVPLELASVWRKTDVLSGRPMGWRSADAYSVKSVCPTRRALRVRRAADR
jgi:hypothetical protein